MKPARTALSAALTLGLVLAVSGAAPSAHADTTVVVQDFTFVSSGVDAGKMSCTNVNGASVPENLGRGADVGGSLGTHHWVAGNAGTSQDAWGAAFEVASMVDQSVWSIDVVASAGDQLAGVAWVVAEPADAPFNKLWVGRAELSLTGTGSWTTVSATDLTFDWIRINATSGAADGTADTPATVSAFAAKHGDGPASYGIGYGCGGGTFGTDAWRVGSPGDVTTYDLEALSTYIDGGFAGVNTIMAGGSATIYGRIFAIADANYLFPEGTTATLQRKVGAGAWSDLVTKEVVQDGWPDEAEGYMSSAVTPTETAEYRWVIEGNSLFEDATSKPRTLSVRAVVAAAPTSPTAKVGRTITVKGSTTPAKPGSTVTLWRFAPGADPKLATAKVSPTGAFQLTTKARTPGRWKVYVTLPDTPTNLGGRSSMLTVTVG